MGNNDERSFVPGTVSVTIYGEWRNRGNHKGNPGDISIVDELNAAR
ncbi:hypothetical protein GCM10027169_01450 [Gordonia jinhuaensis]|uniref:Uncharacterized protein n=1 Tax=Gordonia jinhuaensis TaxID=1517702 RepID=A0A916THE0_9ACTN|nr:hypothetical protein [Gordonia jinhuaensis]GGB44949.1 hypothetical protein GCM10011489_35480 [Gordonia jinhuaensis]